MKKKTPLSAQELWSKFWWFHPVGLALAALGIFGIDILHSTISEVLSGVADQEALIRMPTLTLSAIPAGTILGPAFYALILVGFCTTQKFRVRHQAVIGKICIRTLGALMIGGTLVGVLIYIFLVSTAKQAGYRDCHARHFNPINKHSVMWGASNDACQAYCNRLDAENSSIRCRQRPLFQKQ